VEFLSKNEQETAQISADFVKTKLLVDRHFPKTATVVGLYGELGSGKTTFVRFLAENFGIKDAIRSPTFVIEKIYELSNQFYKHLIHIDAYRIENEEEMINLGWEEIVANPQNLICVEWPEKLAKIIPEHIVVKFEHVRENERKISIA